LQSPDNSYLICALEGALLKTNLHSERLIQGAKNTLDKVLSSQHDLKRLKLENEEKNGQPLTIPLNEDVVAFLKEQKASGRQLFLDTSESTAEIEHILANDLTFDGYINLHSEALPENFDYIGSSNTSANIWKHADKSYLVGKDNSSGVKFEKHFETPSASFAAIVKAVRAHQWLKNLLVFVPIITSQQFMAPGALINTIIMFFCFGAVASFGYIVNDLLDLQSDRIHQSKKNRPFASGTLSISQGLIIGVVLLALATTACLFLPPACILVLTGYLALTIFYSLYLKTKIMMDVVALGALFTLRVIGGAAAIETELSFYLLSFSIFLFSSLGMVKRYAELYNLRAQNLLTAHGRGYRVEDMAPVRIIGISLGYMSVFVMGEYINSPLIAEYYSKPKFIWLLFPLITYWLGRLWLLANRGEVNEDPLIFAIKDKVSLLIAAISGLILALAN